MRNKLPEKFCVIINKDTKPYIQAIFGEVNNDYRYNYYFDKNKCINSGERSNFYDDCKCLSVDKFLMIMEEKLSINSYSIF